MENNNKIILGLDLGTNSIGWALTQQDFNLKSGKILGMGSRIIPMSQDILGEFAKGNSISQTAERTRLRSTRRLRERFLLRRERLHRILNIIDFLPNHYSLNIDFTKNVGKFKENTEPKLAYKTTWNELKRKNEHEFIFKNSFEEMLKEFKQYQQKLLTDDKDKTKLIPYDWTIYYLRKKAITQRIEKEELAWILLNFNQKRGYYQLRGEDDNNSDKVEYVVSLKVIQIEKGNNDVKNNKKNWYDIKLENGWIYSATFYSEPQWLNLEKEFLITEEVDEYGNIKLNKDKKSDSGGKEKRKITPLPSFEEIDLMTKKDQDKYYTKIKAKTEATISNSQKTVGTYIYESLLNKPNQKIRGKLIRTIERKFYKNELREILQKQKEFHTELQNDNLFIDCIRELYKNNESHQIQLSSKDFVHLFLDDIIFYQRPLKSQKSSISNCTLEYRKYKDNNGVEQKYYLKVIPKSNPYYQEFRIWQWLFNLAIYRKDNDSNVTSEFLKTIEDYEKLFEFLMGKKEVDHEDVLKHLLEPQKLKSKELKSEIAKYRWNYVYDSSENKSKSYPCNVTGYEIRSRLKKVAKIPENFLSRTIEQELWHLVYSVTDKIDFDKALKTFALKHGLDTNSFKEAFINFPPFKSEFGAYSEKAIKKLLPLMRLGKYWDWDSIDEISKSRIGKILTGEYDENIKTRVREKALHLNEERDFQGLQLWLAQYIVYDRHSESEYVVKWDNVAQLGQYINEFKQHSLRNPIVEQVVTETLRIVKDIWQHPNYGKGSSNYFDEIHIELGREMKNTADERKRITTQIFENENTNLRIKALISELKENSDGTLNVDNVRPYSPIQQEALKIFEDGVINSDIEIPEDIFKISKASQPSKSELIRYKLWLEQKYRSPYTGSIIPLSKLFTTEYEIEHIIPRSLYFDDSLSNKVICESTVNKLKDNQLGYEFIKNHHGEKVECGNKSFQIFETNEYEDFIKQHYAKNRTKRNKLLLDDIPEKMIERQLNDTRYISKFISSVLSNIVRSEINDDGINSKNLIPGNGKVTNELKHDWGLNDVWNDLILPRFERLNKITNESHFTTWNENHQKYLPQVPLALSKNFSKKRIDHRHHAMDALIIACATRDHINLLNNIHAKSKIRFDLNRKLRHFEKTNYTHPVTGERIEREIPKEFIKPWANFTLDAKLALENIVISFKQNLRVINKATNHFEKWTIKDGKKVKLIHTQEGINWSIRKDLHQATVSGKIDLPRIKVPKGKILTATRKSIDTSFDLKTIESITDSGIQKILKNYLHSRGNNPELAFSPEGIDYLNKHIELFNDGVPHQPIYKVRIFELGSRFALGQTGNKKSKYVEAAKGTNLFFAIYEDENGKRNFETIPLNIVIERQKQGLNSVPFKNDKSENLLFHLSPDDLIYIPSEEEIMNKSIIDLSNLTHEQKKRLYNVNDFSSTCYYTPNSFSKAIMPKEVDLKYDIKNNKILGSFDSKTASFEGKQIKDICIKLKIDRLGNIFPNNIIMQNENKSQNIFSEPKSYYKKNNINTFTSFEDAEEAMAKEKANTSPEQHIINTTERIKEIYKEELKTPMDKNIKFRND